MIRIKLISDRLKDPTKASLDLKDSQSDRITIRDAVVDAFNHIHAELQRQDIVDNEFKKHISKELIKLRASCDKQHYSSKKKIEKLRKKADELSLPKTRWQKLKWLFSNS